MCALAKTDQILNSLNVKQPNWFTIAQMSTETLQVFTSLQDLPHLNRGGNAALSNNANKQLDIKKKKNSQTVITLIL